MGTFIQLLNDWLPAFSVIVSAVISWIVAGIKAKTELRKMKYEFAHQDKDEFFRAFAELMSTTDAYCSFDCQDTLSKAIYANSRLLSLSPQKLTSVVNEMHIALNNRNIEHIKQVRDRLISTLSQIIQHT